MSKIPLPGEKHYTATVFLVTDKEPRQVLLVHHKKLNKWMPPGGHQENKENAYQTAIREIKEETGIDISEYLPKPKRIDERAMSLPLPDYIFEESIEAHKDQPEHFHLDLIYVVTVPHQKVTHQQTESYAIGWFTKAEIEQLSTFKNVAMIIKKIL